MSIERRKYFRIQDTALVKYRVIQEGMLDAERRKVYMNQVKFENARAALFGLETELQESLDHLRSREPRLVEAFELINRKINLLERVVSLEQTAGISEEIHEHEPKEINLSAGGMAINAECPLAAGANLVIDLVLLPANDPMRIFGSVVECRRDANDQHQISIAFDEIRPDDQDRLVRHTLQRQSVALREQRSATA